MEATLLTFSFINFLIYVGFPILILKLFSLIIFKILSNEKFETFLVFSVLSIIEIIFVTIFLIRQLQTPEIWIVLGVIIYMLVINLIFLFQISGKMSNTSWSNFWIMTIISIAMFVFMMAIFKVNYFI